MTKSIYKYDYLCYIGRFQPFHKGHLDVMEQALELSEKLIVVMGSHDRPLEYKNPFDSKVRTRIIQDALPSGLSHRVEFCYQVDHTYNEERWLASIQAQVTSRSLQTWRAGPTRIGIVGYNKDHSSFYLKKFPQWEQVTIKPKYPELNATNFREALFCDFPLADRMKFIEPFVVSHFHEEAVLRATDAVYSQMSNERRFLKEYHTRWGTGPFLTVDSLVTQAGHILVVERGPEYGGGLWALPGGFVNPKETFREAVLRELFEETEIDVPKPALNGSIVQERLFDNPDRSARGRIITQCSHFKLNDMYELPKIRGADDAAKAFWITLSDFAKNRNKFFEDHYNIVESMLGM